ncbi:putative S-formylglutathione hydrolase [Ancylostoma ceylanicum]|uniref:S-formylglutathione hydrolase n=1 Tax=Ancylostoma ceylanicum TaxID=53326 RepID=A0A0D6LDY9_9BILA|nr:putative S-formylglutathione hydrolase [Ancylostoma ceylanicum]
MHFGAYIPDHKEGERLPGLFYLSGLTCTHANFMEKSGFQRFASEYGAGFYLDATVEPWSKHYKMYSYVTKELPELIKNLLPVDLGRLGIFGHSMGGHGAISIGLKNPDLFKSISAFAPICNPMNCPWGKKAFTGYLGKFGNTYKLKSPCDSMWLVGPDTKTWEQYDSSLLLKAYKGSSRKVLIDQVSTAFSVKDHFCNGAIQGANDSFLPAGQLLPESLKSTDTVSVELRMQPEYDHSYYFIATFIGDHFKHHAEVLKK